jgi:hypothetical protein
MVDNLYCEAMEDHVLAQWDEKKGVPQGVARIKDVEWVDFFHKHKGDKIPSSCYWDYVQEGGGSKIFHQECATLAPVRLLRSACGGNTRTFPLPSTSHPFYPHWTAAEAFMLDTENDLLMRHKGPFIPQGATCHLNEEWALHVQTHINDYDECTWDQYGRWVEGGGGDFGFCSERE